MPLRWENVPRLRSSEWVAIGYFVYVAAIAPFFISEPWRAALLAVGVGGVFLLASLCRPVVRDFAPLPLMLAAYREMDWFTPSVKQHHWEQVWVVWDRLLFNEYDLRAAVESTGPLLPGLLELCYLFVYAVAPVALWALYANGKGGLVKHFWTAYLAGTLGAYALFPYFPSEPPRIAFAGEDLPGILTPFRQLNLLILGGYGIHSSVFPSAHVSSAFSAAWALLVIMPRRRWIGWSFAAYGAGVALATVYGRYHYAADALAGFGVSLIALPIESWVTRKARA